MVEDSREVTRRPSRTTPPRCYLAFTPFHLLVIGALQRMETRPAFVAFADEAGVLEDVPLLLASIPDATIIKLDPLDNAPTWPLIRGARRNADRVLEGLKDSGVDASDFLVCNAARPDMLRLASVAHHASFSYVEDGLDTYVPRSEASHGGRVRRRISDALFGYRGPDSWNMTTILDFEAYFVLHPEAVSSAIDGHDVQQIDHDAFIETVRTVATGCAEVHGIGDITDLYLLSRSKNSDHASEMLAAISAWAETPGRQAPGRQLGVKAHPRERDQQLLSSLEVDDRFVTLPHRIPTELFTESLHRRCSFTADASTFVMTSRVLLPDRNIELSPTSDDAAARFLMSWDPSISFQRPLSKEVAG